MFIITYICIDRGLELVCVLVVVLAGVRHDPVENGLLLLQLALLVILLGGELDQVRLRHLEGNPSYKLSNCAMKLICSFRS